VSPLEFLAFLLGLANIALLVRRSLWNFPFGIAMVSLYLVIFVDAKLYSDALLQIFFFAVQFYGWWHWYRGRDTQGELIVRQTPLPVMAGTLIAIALATGLWGWLMHRYTDAHFPWWDASVAMTSIAAQILLSRRWIGNWPLWVLADVIAIPLYAAKDLWLTAGLYVIFLIMSLWGWREWIVAARGRPTLAPA